jgi:4-amino-4-deoxy-L-arabinose transferase-like glycosyltransferase
MSPVKYWDETIYVNLARNLVTYHEYSFLHGFADFSPDWPLAGFRPPLLSLILSLAPFNNFFINLVVPLMSSLGILFLFFLSKKLFNERVAIYSSIIFALFPLNIFWGSKILTDMIFLTFIILSCYFFWLTFYEKKGFLSSALFGIFCALAFLSRYSMIWFFPLFFIFLLIEYKGLSFILETRFIISLISFFILILPWFIFNYFQYDSIFGFLIQANQSTLRWGVSPFYFYLPVLIKYSWFLIPFFITGLLDKEYKRSTIFLVIWSLVVFFSASLMGHKEERYLLPLLPALFILSSVGISKIKKYLNLIIVLISIGLLIANIFLFSNIYSTFNLEEQKCFFNSMDFLKKSNVSYIVTEHFSPVYFYTIKSNVRVNNYTETINLIKENYPNKTIYYFYVDGDWFNLSAENESLKNNIIYSCNNTKIFTLTP